MTQKFTVTTQEIVAGNGGPHQLILAILKEKGAPIQGTLWLSVKPGFYFSVEETLDGSLLYLFEEQTKVGIK